MRPEIKDLISEMGSQKALAEELGITPQYLGEVLRLEEVPPGLARKIEYLTRGELPAERSCPSVFRPRWAEIF